MKVIITKGSYGFGHEWTLEAYTKAYHLGQDVKFCTRVLGMAPMDVIHEIGSADIQNDKVNKRLASFIVKQLGGRKRIINLNSWELCAS